MRQLKRYKQPRVFITTHLLSLLSVLDVGLMQIVRITSTTPRGEIQFNRTGRNILGVASPFHGRGEPHVNIYGQQGVQSDQCSNQGHFLLNKINLFVKQLKNSVIEPKGLVAL
jgi:hypothetical protein